jgi:replicative DNA helicase
VVGLSSEKLRTGKIRKHEWVKVGTKVKKTLEKAPLFIDDTPSFLIFDLRANKTSGIPAWNPGIIIVDLLQLMTAGEMKRRREQRTRNQYLEI